jgi:hypothetical protein
MPGRNFVFTVPSEDFRHLGTCFRCLHRSWFPLSGSGQSLHARLERFGPNDVA